MKLPNSLSLSLLLGVELRLDHHPCDYLCKIQLRSTKLLWLPSS